MTKLKSLDARVKRVTLALTVTAVLQAGSALAALELRDINGNATANTADAEFAYDTVLDATWYLTANNTGLTWDEAKSWAAGLTVGSFSGWSLPAADPGCGWNFNCTGSQMGSLYYTALGNQADLDWPYDTLNTGPFKNLQSYVYWTGTEAWSGTGDAPNPDGAWDFYTDSGIQSADYKYNVRYALAVRPGDVAAVPEPGIVAMLLSGLAGVLVMQRKRLVSS